MTNKVVIVGAGETGSMLHDYLTYDSEYEVVGFSVESKYIRDNVFKNLPVVPLESMRNKYNIDDVRLLIAISYADMNNARSRLYNQCKKWGYGFISYISSKSSVWNDVVVGENVVLMEECSIQHGVTIGNNVVIWPMVSIGHMCSVEDNCWIASGCSIGGFSRINRNSFLGINTTIKNNVKIEQYSLVGAGSYINKDTEEYSIYVTKGTESIVKELEDRKRMQKFFMGA